MLHILQTTLRDRLTTMTAAVSVLIGVLLSSAMSTSAASALTNTISLTPSDDTYVSQAVPDSNFGNELQLLNNNTSGQVQRSYLKFNVTGIPAGAIISNATLRLTANAASSATANVKALTNNVWSESTLTYANAPAYSTTTISNGTPAPIVAGPVDFNVSSYIKSNGVWSLVITQSQATQTSWASRESMTPPQLSITYNAASTSPTVQMTSPANSAIVSGMQTVSAQASDSSGIANVQFQLDGVNLGVPVTVAPYSLQWNTTLAADGPHSLTAVALNNTNMSSTSTAIPVNVNNTRTTGGADPIIAAAGDIACEASAIKSATTCHQLETSRLLGGVSNVLALGDTQYNSGAYSDFITQYDPSWGQYKSITKPVPGNHEGTTASGYYQYFGSLAGVAGKGWYSYDIGTWHILAINSNLCALYGCTAGSEQEQWVKADLAAHPTACTLAYWHQPRWASGSTLADNPYMSTIYADLYNGGADVLLAGHNHAYERFYPMDPAGTRNDTFGIQEIIVGTGGRNHGGNTPLRANSVLRNDTAFGVMKMTLHPNSYDWQFVPESGVSFTDSGTRACH